MRTAVIALAVLACGPRDAGFGDVGRIVRERSREEVRWTYLEPDASSGEVQRLLSSPLTADSAVRIALLWNRDLQAMFEDLGIARARWASAARPSNPTVEGDVQLESRNGSTTEHLEIAILQSVTDLVYAAVRASIAGASLESTKQSVARAVLGFVFETKTSFYEVQAAEQAFELHRSIVEASRASFELARRMHEAGNMNDLDLSIERGLYEDSRLTLARAEQRALEAREALNARLGLFGDDTGWRASSRLPDPPREPIEPLDLEKKVIEASLELASLKLSLEATGRQLGLARTERWIPNVAIGVEVEGEVAGGAPPLLVGPAFQVTLPLWDQGQGEILRAEAELRRLGEVVAATAVRLRADARRLRARAESQRRQALHLRDVILPLRNRTLEQAELMQNAMQIGLFQLLTTKQAQIEAARDSIDALADYGRAQAELDLLLAGGSRDRAEAMDVTDAPRRRGRH